MNAEVSRIFLGRSRGRGNGVANENGSRQGKLIRSGAMTREKLRSEMDEQLSSPPPALLNSLLLSLRVFHHATFRNLHSPLYRRKCTKYQGNFNLSDYRVICASRGARVRATKELFREARAEYFS